MKSTFLKVMGILFLVSGSFGLIMILNNILSVYHAMGVYEFFALIGEILTLTAGIMGIVYFGNRAKAVRCVVSGVLVIAVRIVADLLYISSPALTVDIQFWDSIGIPGYTAVLMAVGFIMPVLYLISAICFIRKDKGESSR